MKSRTMKILKGIKGGEGNITDFQVSVAEGFVFTRTVKEDLIYSFVLDAEDWNKVLIEYVSELNEVDYKNFSLANMRMYVRCMLLEKLEVCTDSLLALNPINDLVELDKVIGKLSGTLSISNSTHLNEPVVDGVNGDLSWEQLSINGLGMKDLFWDVEYSSVLDTKNMITDTLTNLDKIAKTDEEIKHIISFDSSITDPNYCYTDGFNVMDVVKELDLSSVRTPSEPIVVTSFNPDPNAKEISVTLTNVKHGKVNMNDFADSLTHLGVSARIFERPQKMDEEYEAMKIEVTNSIMKLFNR